MHIAFRLLAATYATALLALASGCGDSKTCDSPVALPVVVYVSCDVDSFAPADELGATALIVEGRVGGEPRTECYHQSYPTSPEAQHLCELALEGYYNLPVFDCGNRVTEVRARQGSRTAQAFTYYNKLSCAHERPVDLMLTAHPN